MRRLVLPAALATLTLVGGAVAYPPGSAIWQPATEAPTLSPTLLSPPSNAPSVEPSVEPTLEPLPTLLPVPTLLPPLPTLPPLPRASCFHPGEARGLGDVCLSQWWLRHRGG